MKALYKGLVNKQEEAQFKLLKDIQLPEICDPNGDDSKEYSIFKAGSKFIGFPAELEFVIKDENGKFKKLPKEQFIVKETAKGIYAMPFNNIDPDWEPMRWDNTSNVNGAQEVGNDLDKDIEGIVDTAKEILPKKPVELFGFTYKQLAVIALVGVVTSKILK